MSTQLTYRKLWMMRGMSVVLSAVTAGMGAADLYIMFTATSLTMALANAILGWINVMAVFMNLQVVYRYEGLTARLRELDRQLTQR